MQSVPIYSDFKVNCETLFVQQQPWEGGTGGIYTWHGIIWHKIAY